MPEQEGGECNTARRPDTLQPKLPPSSELATRMRAINSTAGPAGIEAATATPPPQPSGGSGMPMGGAEVPMHPCGALTEAEREAFDRDGFVILRGVVPAEECRRFLWQAVEPALRRKGVLYDDERTWEGKYGDVITAPDGTDHPIPQSSPDSRWPALFNSNRLRKVLDDVHGGKGKWRWVHGAASGVGWIHVRYPVVEASEEWDWEDRRWHIDGDTGRIDTHQSVIVLPMVTPISAGGGGTALLRGSHHHVARWLHDNGEWGVGNHRRINTIVQKAIEEKGLGAVVEATGAAGDVLVPLIVIEARGVGSAKERRGC